MCKTCKTRCLKECPINIHHFTSINTYNLMLKNTHPISASTISIICNSDFSITYMNVLQYINHFAVMNDVSFHLLDLFFLLFFIFLDLLFFSKLLLLLPPNVYCLAKELGVNFTSPRWPAVKQFFALQGIWVTKGKFSQQ